jgi:hypothetical protein
VIKPKLNPNVVAAVPNIFTPQDCLRYQVMISTTAYIFVLLLSIPIDSHTYFLS